ARVVQGLAGGLMSVAFALVRDVLPATSVAGGIGLLAAVLSVGAATGIVLSGPIATGLGSSWLFWLPFAVLVPTTVLAWAVLPSVPSRKRARLDWAGAALLTGWLVSLLLAVSQGPSWGWRSPSVLALFAASLVLLVAWI